MSAEPLSRASAPALSVSEAGTQDRLAWQAYVRGHPDATFFHRWEWRALMADLWRHQPIFLIARRGDEVCGVLPLAHMKTLLFGSQLIGLPFCVYGGPLVSDDAALRALDEHAMASARRCGASQLEYRNLMPAHPDWPGTALYATFRKPISADEAVNLKAIPRKQRAMVRKGIGHRLQAGVEDVEAFFPIYADNAHRHGTPGLPRRWFHALQQAFGDDCTVLVVRDNAGRAVSAVMTFWHGRDVMPYYAGDYARARELAANDFKYWALLCEGVARGCRRFDFGRSKVGSGPYDFKRNWGFEPTPLAYEYQLLRGDALARHNPANPRYRLLIQAWRQLPRPVVNWLGPRIVRGLG